MRYAIIGATVQQVRSISGAGIKEARSTGIIFATLTKEQADRLKSLGCQVTEVGKVEAVVMPPVPVAAAPIYTPTEVLELARFEELRQLFTPPIYGEGFNMAIIGTGIRETHVEVNGRVIYRKNYTEDPMRDGLDHDTGVCSIVLAVAPLCGILNLKVLDDKGVGTEEEVTLAIDDCIALNEEGSPYAPSIINLSLGSPDDNNPSNPLRVACRAAIERGIYVGASAGNSGPNPYSITSPACEQYVFAVGSVKYLPDNGAYIISDWSSRGPTLAGLVKPDAVMFGEDIDMASSASDTARTAKSGTSFSVPIISGFGLLYKQAMSLIPFITHLYPGVTPGIIEAVPLSEMIDKHLPKFSLRAEVNKNNEVGWGMPFGPLIAQTIGVRPAVVDISTVLASFSPLFALGILGMVISEMTKGFR